MFLISQTRSITLNILDAVVEADPRRLSKVAVIRLGAPYTAVLFDTQFSSHQPYLHFYSGVSSVLRFSLVLAFRHGGSCNNPKRWAAN